MDVDASAGASADAGDGELCTDMPPQNSTFFRRLSRYVRPVETSQHRLMSFTFLGCPVYQSVTVLLMLLVFCCFDTTTTQIRVSRVDTLVPHLQKTG